MTWKRPPHHCYWLFVRGIHRSPVDVPHEGGSNAALYCFFSVGLGKPLNKLSSCWWVRCHGAHVTCQWWFLNHSISDHWQNDWLSLALLLIEIIQTVTYTLKSAFFSTYMYLATFYKPLADFTIIRPLYGRRKSSLGARHWMCSSRGANTVLN